jgi:hypothetical protein
MCLMKLGKGGGMKHLKFILAILIMLAVVIVVVQNHGIFSKKVLFKLDLFSIHYKSADISMYYIVAISFLFGILIAGLYGMIERFRLKREIKALKNISKEKDTELNSLRNLPITSDNVGSGHLNGDVN